MGEICAPLSVACACCECVRSTHAVSISDRCMVSRVACWCVPLQTGCWCCSHDLDSCEDCRMSVRRCRPLRCDAGEIFRVGAKAEGDYVVIGGVGELWRLPPRSRPGGSQWSSRRPRPHGQFRRANCSGRSLRGSSWGALFAFLLFKERAAGLQGVGILEPDGLHRQLRSQVLLVRLMTSKYPFGCQSYRSGRAVSGGKCGASAEVDPSSPKTRRRTR